MAFINAAFCILIVSVSHPKCLRSIVTFNLGNRLYRFEFQALRLVCLSKSVDWLVGSSAIENRKKGIKHLSSQY